MLGKPAGCEPSNSATVAPFEAEILAPAALTTYVLPSVNLEMTAKPFAKSFARSLITTAGSPAKGLVSIAVTKIELGLLSIAGTFP